MNDDTFEIDEIMEGSTKIDATITDSASNYTDEWLTTDYISSSFKSITNILDSLTGDMNEMKVRDRNGMKVGEAESPDVPNIAVVATKHDRLNVREAPGLGSNIVGKLEKGSIIEIGEEVQDEDDDKQVWVEVKGEDGKIGYVSKEFIIQGDAGEVKTSHNKLNVRSGKGLDNEVVGKLEKGEIAEIIEEDPESGWTEVKYDDEKTGYVSSEFFKKIEPDTNKSTLTTTASVLNLREGPGTNTKIMGHLKKGDTVRVVGEADKKGWVQVEVNGQTYYANNKYLS